MSKPDWWPENPYEGDIPPHPEKRNAWEMASIHIREAVLGKLVEIIESFDELEKSEIQEAFGIYW